MVSRTVIFWTWIRRWISCSPAGSCTFRRGKTDPQLKRLTDAAREGRVFIIGDACTHTPDDPEFQTLPRHCVRGTPGAEIIPRRARIKSLSFNRADAAIPEDLSEFQQSSLKNRRSMCSTIPIRRKCSKRVAGFTSADAEIFVFGVVTEYCVRLAAKGLLERGRRVALVSDAIETLEGEDGRKTLEELTSLGARLVTTEQALAALDRATTNFA